MIKRAYERLYRDCKKLSSFKKIVYFAAMKGSEYDKSSCRFMLIGRAPNGWGEKEPESSNADSFGNDMAGRVEDTARWKWVERRNGALYSGHSTRYCISQKPFWSYARAVWRALCDERQDDDVWMKNIVWTNLYKASPDSGGNPNKKSRRVQLEACREILKEELERFKPTHILVLTGYDWFADFASLFEDAVERGNEYGEKEMFVEGSATYNGAKVVIACRPEFRRKQEYVCELLEAFQK